MSELCGPCVLATCWPLALIWALHGDYMVNVTVMVGEGWRALKPDQDTPPPPPASTSHHYRQCVLAPVRLHYTTPSQYSHLTAISLQISPALSCIVGYDQANALYGCQCRAFAALQYQV